MTRFLVRAVDSANIIGKGKGAEMSESLERAIEASEDRSSNKDIAAKDIVAIQQLIDLTDKPIKLTRDEISWSQVKSNASNCICCCTNSSITLVTTDNSYALDHIPLDNIVAAQASPGLQYLALANDQKLAITDLVENKLAQVKTSAECTGVDSRPSASDLAAQTRFVNLCALGLSMSDVLLWRWIDELTLAFVTRDALYTCQVDQIQINHHATTALRHPLNQLLSLARVCGIDPNLGLLCQVTNVQRDNSANLYAISGLYLPQTLTSSDTHQNHQHQSSSNDNSHLVNSNQENNNNNNNNNNASVTHKLAVDGALRHNFSSVPSRLSQMATAGINKQHISLASFNVKSQKPLTVDSLRRKISSLSKPKQSPTSKNDAPAVGGLAQIYCKLRDRSQVIQAHAVAFTCNNRKSSDDEFLEKNPDCHYTTLVAANRISSRLKVYFIGMATTEDLTTSGQNVARSIKLDSDRSESERLDFPTAIVCSSMTPEDDRTHIAMIVTKYGRLFVCSITQGSILFDVKVSHDIVSTAQLESKSRGLMLICRNGQVLLVRIDEVALRRILDHTHNLRYVSSQSVIDPGNHDYAIDSANQQPPDNMAVLEPPDIGLEVIISTKL